MIERYTRPEMGRIWSQDNRLRVMLRVEEAFLEVLSKDKGIPNSELKAFKAILGRKMASKVRGQEAKSGHEVVGLIAAVSKEIARKAPNLGRYLHYGLTSSDVLDTALAIQLRDSCSLLISAWMRAAARIRALSRRHRMDFMAGRTHGVHAEPITFGVKLAGWHCEAQRNIERLRRAKDLISYGKLSGAVGCFTQVGPAYEARVCSMLGLRKEPVSTQVVPRDRHADYFHALVLSAAALERFAVEIRHLQKTEVLEVEEPFTDDQKGSSAMPHKRNPVLCENLTGLSRLIRSHETAVVENCILWHERDISHSSVERIVLPDAHIALDFMLDRFIAILDGLRVNPKRMRLNLESSMGLVFSQKVLLKLIDAGLGRLRAYEIVQRNAMKTWRTGRHFHEILAEDEQVASLLSKKQLDECFDLGSYKNSSNEILRRGGVI